MKQTLEDRIKVLEKRMEICEEKIRVLHHRSIANQGALPAKADLGNPYEVNSTEEYVKDDER